MLPRSKLWIVYNNRSIQPSWISRTGGEVGTKTLFVVHASNRMLGKHVLDRRIHARWLSKIVAI